jgi:hypothetical protein
MGFHVALAFPLLVWPARNVLDELMFGIEYKVTKRQQIRHAIETLVLVFTSFGIAIVVPNITTVFGKIKRRVLVIVVRVHWFCMFDLFKFYISCCFLFEVDSNSFVVETKDSCIFGGCKWNNCWCCEHSCIDLQSDHGASIILKI